MIEKNQEKQNEPCFLLINKPVGITSHDVIDKLRKITGIKKIGHAGTLDPFASGLLIVAVGRQSTKQIANFVHLDKKYVATLQFGSITDTYDNTGQTKKTNSKKIEQGDLEEVLPQFTGEIKQIPPMYSAKKIKGKKLCNLARQGLTIERNPITIKIHQIKIKEFNKQKQTAKIFVHCSSGTYIRALAHDIGQGLAVGAHLTALTRTAIGEYNLEQAQEISQLEKENWQK